MINLKQFVDEDNYIEHDQQLQDGVVSLQSALEAQDEGRRRIDYHHVHKILAEGSFVLCISEGNHNKIHCAFYDLFRIANGKIVEHWDTTEKIAPLSEWKNNNGKF